MTQVTLEESISAFYRCVFRNYIIDDALSLNPKLARMARGKLLKDEILGLHSQGSTIRGLAREYGLDRGTICNWINERKKGDEKL